MVHVGGFRLRVTRRAVADVRCRPSCESCLCVSPLFRPSPFRCAISWRPSDVRPQFLVPYDLSRYWHAGRSVPIAPERGPFRVTTAQLYSDVSLVRHKTKRFTVQLRCVRQFAALPRTFRIIVPGFISLYRHRPSAPLRTIRFPRLSPLLQTWRFRANSEGAISVATVSPSVLLILFSLVCVLVPSR